MAYSRQGAARAGGVRRGIQGIAAAATLSACAGAGWYGCAIYDPSLLVSSDGGDNDGASSDGGGDGAPGDDGGCAHATPPPRPTTNDGTQDLLFVVALHGIDFGASLDAGSLSGVGYDLDGVCTCPGPPSCKTNDPKQMHCDDDAGRDNAGGALLKDFALLSGGTFTQDGLNRNIEAGLYGLVMRIEHYNGGANDTDVTVSIFVSNGTPPGRDAGPNDHMVPAWNGTDSWTLDSASVFGGSGDAGRVIPNFADTHAYVANHVLVASADFPLTLGSSGLVTLEFVGGFVTANIVPQGGTYKLSSGILAGRWPTTKLLGTLQSLSLAGLGNVCKGTQTYRDVKTRICGGADISAELNADAGSGCNALSLAIQFSADPAQLGAVEPRTPSPPLCPDAGTDDCP